jgi:hypothetical protein
MNASVAEQCGAAMWRPLRAIRARMSFARVQGAPPRACPAAYPAQMTARHLPLTFNPRLDELSSRKELRDGLSAVLQVGHTLWVANDESSTVERLTIHDGQADQHVQFALADFLDLALPPESKQAQSAPEVDIEGLDHDGGYLWIAGSHSLKRDKPGHDDTPKAARQALRRVSQDANRYLLARIPLFEQDGSWQLARQHKGVGGTLKAARLRGARHGNELMEVLRRDRHLRDFMCIPGKENGFDIEGLAVRGDRMFLGLRGPVLRGWALILELRIGDARKAGRLRLLPVDGKGRRVRKHFLDLGGRGVRDIHLDGDDVLVLAGPTMPLDGKLTVLRWPGALRGDTGCLVRAEQLQHVMDLPHGTACDHAEGITFHRAPGSDEVALLVVHDAASPQRQVGDSTLLADVLPLPHPPTAK